MNRTVVFGLLAIVLAFGLIGCDTGDGSENNGCTVTFDLDGGNIGGNTSPVLRTVKSGETIALALFPQPVKQDYNLTGWITSSGNTFDENTKITSLLQNSQQTRNCRYLIAAKEKTEAISTNETFVCPLTYSD